MVSKRVFIWSDNNSMILLSSRGTVNLLILVVPGFQVYFTLGMFSRALLSIAFLICHLRYLISQYPLAWLIQRFPVGKFLGTPHFLSCEYVRINTSFRCYRYAMGHRPHDYRELHKLRWCNGQSFLLRLSRSCRNVRAYIFPSIKRPWLVSLALPSSSWPECGILRQSSHSAN